MNTPDTSPHSDSMWKSKNVPGTWLPVAAGVTLMLGVVLFSVGNCGILSSSPSSLARVGASPKEEKVAVRTVRPEKRVLTQTFTSIGEVKAERHAVLKSKVGGTIADVRVDLGDRVAKGQILVHIEPGTLLAELRKKEAQLEVMESRVHKAALLAAHHGAEYERRARLHAEAALSASELAQAKITADTAQADAKLMQAEMASAKADLGAIRIRLADTELRAPFAGKIAARFVDSGTSVSAGDVLVSMVSEGKERIAFSLPESAVHWVKPGQQVSVRVANRTQRATVRHVGATLQTENRSLPVIAQLTDENESIARALNHAEATEKQVASAQAPAGTSPSAASVPTLLPGMFVEVTLHTQSPSQATIIPVAALSGQGAEQSVYRLDTDNHARTHKVRVVFREGEYAAVLGLSEEHSVVVAGVDKLRDGLPVEVIP